MPSYLVTGANRGIGFGYLNHISKDSSNVVIGLVRDKAATDKKVAEELAGRPNIHIVEAQITDYESLKNSVAQVSKITGGSLDYVIANAAAQDSNTLLGDLAQDHQKFEDELLATIRVNVTATINLFALCLPLIRKGQAKKLINISTGMADVDMIAKFQVAAGPIYSMSKAAGNVAIAKLDVQYRQEGILFMSISPGMVATNMNAAPTDPKELELVNAMMQAFQAYAPGWKGPISVDESATAVLSTIHSASLEKGFGGSFVSHYGNKQWL